MNTNKIRNIIKLVISGLLYYTGILALLNRVTKRTGLLVINYHNFNTFTNDYWRKGSLYEVNYDRMFEKQIKFIRKSVGFVNSPRIKSDDFVSDLSVLLTFDDGYLDNYTCAAPVLRKHRAPAIFFVVTGLIGTDQVLKHDQVRLLAEKNALSKKEAKKLLSKINAGRLSYTEILEERDGSPSENGRLMMTWQEVKSLVDSGFEVGAHTRNHPVLANLSYSEERTEITQSKHDISENTGRTPVYFSPPNGIYSSNTKKILDSCGIEYAFSTEPGINTSLRDRYKLKRIGVNPSDPIPLLALKIVWTKLNG